MAAASALEDHALAWKRVVETWSMVGRRRRESFLRGGRPGEVGAAVLATLYIIERCITGAGGGSIALESE